MNYLLLMPTCQLQPLVAVVVHVTEGGGGLGEGVEGGREGLGRGRRRGEAGGGGAEMTRKRVTEGESHKSSIAMPTCQLQPLVAVVVPVIDVAGVQLCIHQPPHHHRSVHHLGGKIVAHHRHVAQHHVRQHIARLVHLSQKSSSSSRARHTMCVDTHSLTPSRTTQTGSLMCVMLALDTAPRVPTHHAPHIHQSQKK